MPGAPLHIVFCGTSAFAAPSLRALSGDPRFMVDAVITQPDRPVGRAQTLTPPPVKVLAQKNNIPVHQPEKIKENLLREVSIKRTQEQIAEQEADLKARNDAFRAEEAARRNQEKNNPPEPKSFFGRIRGMFGGK